MKDQDAGVFLFDLGVLPLLAFHAPIRRMRRLFALLVCLWLPVVIFAQEKPPATPAATAPDFPDKDWQLVSPESQGYSSAKLEALRSWLAANATSSMVIIVHGRMIFRYGDIAHISKIASVRKSILCMLYGTHFDALEKSFDLTVEDLGLAEPDRPFLPMEKSATLLQLLAGRSGIYLLPAEELGPGSDAVRSAEPRRGSEYPGLYFHYNDWDFNAAGTAFEKLTGKNIYDALQSDLAVPLQFQDFDRARQVKVPAPAGEIHPEYAMYLSTRDMARLGLLMLRKGDWNGKQIIPAGWISAATTIWTPFEEMNPPALHALGSPERWGFGLLWWVWDARPYPGDKYYFPFQGAYQAAGTGGQFITILPAEDMVLVHKVDIDPYPRGPLSGQEWDAIMNMAIASACHGACK